ncbi:MAG: FAD-dependent oxidoreductase [Microcystaceae cyanobacterium]
MKFNYDLVIIGATIEGIYAAQEAVKYTNKRIALVTQGVNFKQVLFNAYFQSHLTDLIQQQDSLFYWKQSGYYAENCPDLKDLAAISKNLSQAAVNADDSLSILASQGIDIIEHSGAFNNVSDLGFDIANRKLRSRSYLLAIDPHQNLDLPDFDQGKYWAILGATPENITWACNLALMGKQVTLITGNSHILPQEDEDTAHLLQAYLEAIGINLIVNAKVKKITNQGSQKVLQLKEGKTENKIHKIIVDAIFNNYPSKNINTNLNLKQVGVKLSRNRILVNNHLQTNQPQFYAIAKVIKGYGLLDIARQEALLALKNIFSFQKFPIYYSQIPYRLMIYPAFRRVGLTESQARAIYSDKIEIISGNLSVPSPVKNPLIPTFYKFIFALDQTLIGAHLLGIGDDNSLAFLAIARNQHLKKEQILPLIFPLL